MDYPHKMRGPPRGNKDEFRHKFSIHEKCTYNFVVDNPPVTTYIIRKLYKESPLVFRRGMKTGKIMKKKEEYLVLVGSGHGCSLTAGMRRFQRREDHWSCQRHRRQTRQEAADNGSRQQVIRLVSDPHYRGTAV